MSSNQIESFDKLGYLSKMKNLKTIYLNGNMISKYPSYREEVIKYCPGITQIDHYNTKVTYTYKIK